MSDQVYTERSMSNYVPFTFVILNEV